MAVRETHPVEKVRAARTRWYTRALQAELYVRHPLLSVQRLRAFVLDLASGRLDDLFLNGDVLGDLGDGEEEAPTLAKPRLLRKQSAARTAGAKARSSGNAFEEHGPSV